LTGDYDNQVPFQLYFCHPHLSAYLASSFCHVFLWNYTQINILVHNMIRWYDSCKLKTRYDYISCISLRRLWTLSSTSYLSDCNFWSSRKIFFGDPTTNLDFSLINHQFTVFNILKKPQTYVHKIITWSRIC